MSLNATADEFLFYYDIIYIFVRILVGMTINLLALRLI